MLPSDSPSLTSECLVTDTYSLSDAQLADAIEFVEEIGFGNWGSVWSARSRTGGKDSRRKIACKLVHRTADKTTPARVRSIWNEMKVVKILKNDRHPAIIDFYSFIITPSYALITMEFLPRLVPVEVRESKARVWFHSLLGGVAHLHRHGIAHNDIKPANILLSSKEQPVLVDFGFAEKYDLEYSPASSRSPSPMPDLPRRESSSTQNSIGGVSPTKRPFESCLAYGTPEYLSPERARGISHDTRKSDVWSLGVTFFEILTGRTPFEESEAEEFTTKADLERYWLRTKVGDWIGEWKMSSVLEQILRKMIQPDPSRRISAARARDHPYFATTQQKDGSLRLSNYGDRSIASPQTSVQDVSIASVASNTIPRSGSKSMYMESSKDSQPTRTRLAALQNFMTKQPLLPADLSNTSSNTAPSRPVSAIQATSKTGNGRTPSAPVSKHDLENTPPSTHVAKTRPKSKVLVDKAALTHQKSKSVGRSAAAAGTPLTPKAVAPAPPPRVPPPTPAIPLPIATTVRDTILLVRTSEILKNREEARKATENAAADVSADAAFVPISTRRTVASNLSPKEGAIRDTGSAALGAGNVKVKIKALESRNNASGSPRRSALRLKDRSTTSGSASPPEHGSPLNTSRSRDSETIEEDRRPSSRYTTALKGKEAAVQEEEQTTTDKSSKGRRALQSLAKSIDATKSRASLRMRQSFDRTAEMFTSRAFSAGHKTPRPSLTLNAAQAGDSITSDPRGSFRENSSEIQKGEKPLDLENISREHDSTISPLKSFEVSPDTTVSLSQSISDRMTSWLTNVETPRAQDGLVLDQFGELSPLANLPDSAYSLAQARRDPQAPNSAQSTSRALSPDERSKTAPRPSTSGARLREQFLMRSHSIRSIGSTLPPDEMPTISTIQPDPSGPTTKEVDPDDAASASPDDDAIPLETLEAKTPARPISSAMPLPWLFDKPGKPSPKFDPTAFPWKMFHNPNTSPHVKFAPPLDANPPPVPPKPESPRPPSNEHKPRDERSFDNILVASTNVVKVGKGYESVASNKGRKPTSSASYINAKAQTEKVLKPVKSFRKFGKENKERGISNVPLNDTGSRSKGLTRRSGIFSTVRSSKEETPEASPDVPPLPDNTGEGKSKTLTKRMRSAFKRVASVPAFNRGVSSESPS